jgi:alanine racemase
MNRGYSAELIGRIVNGIVLNGTEINIQHYCIDSRKAFGSVDEMFIAISTKNQDGHDYAQSAYDKGVRCFLVQKELTLPKDAIQIKVVDSVKALQHLAIYHRKRFNIPVIGITGSNGKTIVKEWLNQLLSRHFRICRSPRSFNSQIGVALSVLQLNESHEIAIFEAGISQKDEMELLQRMIDPSVGVLTHLGSAHLENFSSVQELFSEKCKLFQNTTAWVSPTVNAAIGMDVPHLVWGDGKENKWVVQSITRNHAGSTVVLEEDKVKVELNFLFQDDIQIHNAITAAVTARMLGIEWASIQDEVVNLSSVEMRMEQVAGIHQTVIINDAYSFDLASLSLAMQEVFQRFTDRRKVLICSDFPTPQERNQLAYMELSKRIDQYKWEAVYLVGDLDNEMRSEFPEETLFFKDTLSLIGFLESRDWREELILVKGARNFEFERIVQRLQESNHLTRLEVDLNALRNNLNYYRSRLQPSTRMMAMVKAFGYGTGAKEVAQLLEENRVDYLGVAYIDEGIALRKAGVSLPIMVMNPESEGIHALINYQLEPEIYSLKSFRDWMIQKDRYHLTQPLKIHLKIDTGMHRLGLAESDWNRIKEEIVQRSDLEVISIFTHLSSADVPSADDFTQNQLNQFEKAKVFFGPIFPKAFYHSANSSAITRFPSAQMDMVRLGIGMYGVASNLEDQRYLQPVHRWLSHISQIMKVPAGDSVGYGRSFMAKHEMRIATIPVGYADGYKRILSNGKGWIMINGERANVVGRVCMDMLMVDVSAIEAKEGDEVMLLGGEMTLDTMAMLCETIPYEILTSISQRVKRIYIAT